jgi:hypothetical protein
VKKTPQQLADQFIDEAIELHKFINSEIEGAKNSPINHLQRAILGRKEDLDQVSAGTTIKHHKVTSSTNVVIQGLSVIQPDRRKDVLTDVISLAQNEAKEKGLDIWVASNIYGILQRKAELDTDPPLLASTEEGIKYQDGPDCKYLTKKNLAARLSRLKNNL